MAGQIVAGKIQVQINGVLQYAKGDWTYNLGNPKLEAIVGADVVHGWKETPQVAFIEGEITDRGDLDLNALTTLNGATVTLILRNGKTIALRDAVYAGDGTANTEEANIAVRFEGKSAVEVGA